MPGDLRKISLLAIVLLVLLRISIGWHLLYEGLWKLSTLRTPNPWSAEGYLKNSTGPLRDTFRKMTGDPNDLNWLNYDKMRARWEDWRTRFVAHFPKTDQENKKGKIVRDELSKLLDGPESFSTRLDALPPGIDLKKTSGVDKEAIRFDPEAKLLIVDGKKHLLPTERDRLVDAAKKLKESKPELEAVCDKFVTAVNRVAKDAGRLSAYDRLAALLKEDPERVGRKVATKSGKSDDDADPAASNADGMEIQVIVGDVEKYKDYLEFYERQYAKAKTKSDWNHLEKQWTEIQQLRRDLVGPVQAIEQELFKAADELLDADQSAAGPVAPPFSPVQSINQRTMWGLTIFGLLLMLGLFTRLSALGGAALLFLFYMAIPPWPGVQEIPSIEHNLIVNKNFVEMVALLAIATMPTGKWFGVDAAVSALFARRRRD